MVQDKFVARLKPHIEVISVCPEVEIGLGIPRAPVRIIRSGDELKLIQPASGMDLSESMRGFTSGFLDTLEKVDGFILKNRSPSCGFTDVKFYSGPERGPAIGRTAGLFGGAVRQPPARRRSCTLPLIARRNFLRDPRTRMPAALPTLWWFDAHPRAAHLQPTLLPILPDVERFKEVCR